MIFLRQHLLTLLVILPAIGTIPLIFLRGRSPVRWTVLGITMGTFAASLLLLLTFDWHAGSSYAYADDGGVVQMVQRSPIPHCPAVQYLVGIDGLNLPLLIVCAFIFPLATLAAWRPRKPYKVFFALLLLLEATIFGAFLSLDFVLFFAFLEASVLLVGFLICFESAPGRTTAAIKFAAFMLLSAAALTCILCDLHRRVMPAETHFAFDLVRLAAPAIHGRPHETTLFLLSMLGFGILLGIFPLHGWLIGSHQRSPTAVSMILSALVTTLGGYGIFRVAYPLFPHAAADLWLPVAALGIVSVIYGALCALGQTDLKRLLAYSCVSNLGFVLLGAATMTVASMNGATFILVAQAVTSATLFFIAGVLEHRAHCHDLARLGECAASMPVLRDFGTVAFLATLGVPALPAFVGEILVLLGTFAAGSPNSILFSRARDHGHLTQFLFDVRCLAIVACLACVLTAAYLLRTMQRLFFARTGIVSPAVADLDGREIAVLTPLTALMVLLGIFPWLCYFVLTTQTVAAFLKLFS